MSKRDTNTTDDSRFVPQCKLGRGAMGTVFKVHDRERNAVVALKTLRLGDAVAIYRFKREFRALSNLSHPNLIKLYELLFDGDAWFFTMECIEGGTFLSYVRPRPRPRPDGVIDLHERTAPTGVGAAQRLDIGRLRDALGQLARGLHFLHRCGKLHRDVKPSNVLVTRDGRVVLCDFGLVTEAAPADHERTADRRLVGTPAYMAPERSLGTASEASDWYSVGVMLYEALTGMAPFVGDYAEAEARKRSAPPAAPSALASDVPADLDELCTALLDPDPDRRPAGREILTRLGVADTGPAPPLAADAPFVGRAAELGALADAFAQVRGGDTLVACVHASSGMGKTALVRQFLDSLDDAGEATILEGRCYEQESVPYKALDAVVDALTRHLMRLPENEVDDIVPRDILALVRLFPVLRRVEAVALPRAPALEPPDPLESRRRAFGALRSLLRDLSRRQPLVVAIDDLQWGDADSAALLEDLLRTPDPPRMLVVAAYRSEDAATSPFLRAFLPTQPNARALPLPPLSEAEAGELTRRLISDDARNAHELRRQIEVESEGNPFLLTELVWSTRRAGAADARGDALGTVEEMIEQRLGELPPPGRRLLDALAVAGRPIRQDVAKQAAQLEQDAEPILVSLRNNRLLRSRGVRDEDPVECYHDRIREAVLRALEPQQLAGWHRRLALALEGHGDSDRESLATHFHRAGQPRRAAHYAILAAKQAVDALAFDRAVHLYRFALELRPDDATQSASLWERLGSALENAGRGAEAAEAYMAAAEHGPDAQSLDLTRRAAEQLLRSGHVEDGLRAVRVVLDAMKMRLPESPRRALISLLFGRLRTRLRGLRFTRRDPVQIAPERLHRIDACWSVAAGLGMVDTIRGMDFQTRHYVLALDAGDPTRVARAFAIEAMYTSTLGHRARKRTARLTETATRLADEVEDPRTIGFAAGARAMRAYQLGEFAAARENADRALDEFNNRCVGLAWEKSSAELIALWSLWYLGEAAELQRRVPARLRFARERGDLFFETSLCIGVPATHWLAGDRPAEGRRLCEQVMRRWSHLGVLIQHYWEWLALRQLELYEGSSANALRRTRETWSMLDKAFFLRIAAVRAEAHDLRARAAIAAAYHGAADPSQLLRAAARDARALNRERSAWPRALGALHQANILACRAPGARAAAALEAAEADLRAADMKLYAEAARRRRGALVGGDEGAALVRSAEEWMRTQGIVAPTRMAVLLAPGGV